MVTKSPVQPDLFIPTRHSFLNNVANIRSFPKSPLRYPGGKNRAVRTILAYLPSTLKKLCSPFVGGGSIELALAASGVQVYAYDIFAPLVEFWQCAKSNRRELIERIRSYPVPLPREKFYALQSSHLKRKIDRAAAFYVLNRCSFSGSTLSGGMSPSTPRFTESSICYVEQVPLKNFSVKLLDFRASILQHPDCFLYLDPPYLLDQALYGRNGDAHKGFDHSALRAILANRDCWLLSYNDCPAIRDMYAGHTIVSPEWKYGMSNDKNSREILVLSKDLMSRVF